MIRFCSISVCLLIIYELTVYLNEVKMKVRTNVSKKCKDYQLVVRNGNIVVIWKPAQRETQSSREVPLNDSLQSNKVATDYTS